MQQSLARLDDDLSTVLRNLAADVQVSMALSRALLQTVAAISPACAATAETMLQEEAARLTVNCQGSRRVLAALEDMQARIQAEPVEDEMCRALEMALIKAADGLSDDSAPVLSGLWCETGAHAAKAG